jgi:phosphoribosylformylglycinamidine cyclo-ligase
MQQIQVKGLAHITGGGLVENVPRILARGLTAELERAAWPRPALFSWLQEKGGLSDEEMFRVFNSGIGMVVIVDESDAERAMHQLRAAGESVHRIGRIRACRAGEAQTLIG